MQDIIKLKPVFKEKVWGGRKLETEFNYQIPSDQTGECWGISGHENGTNRVVNGPFAGKTVRQLWDENRDLFNDEQGEEFPLLVKIIDAQDDLSVQVHPDNKYAKEHEGYAFGKTECWYILSSEPEAELVLGHHAQTRDDLKKMVQEEKWDELFRTVKVKPGDFVYVPSGTVHAIGKGIVLLEVQQSSDITYRFYDYDRPGQDGKLRELHIEDSIACSMVPHEDAASERENWVENGLSIEQLIKEEYFTVQKWTLKKGTDSVLKNNEGYKLVTVTEGEIRLKTAENVHALRKGTHFLVPSTLKQFEIEGDGELIAAETTN